LKRTAFFLAAAITVAAESNTGFDVSSWWTHVSTLADDQMEGRKTGTPGHRRAAEYVAEQFRKAGLEPAGADGFFQPVEFTVRQIDESKSGIELLQEKGVHRVKLGEEANLAAQAEPGALVEADAVFAGYGLQIPEMEIDDLAGLDLRGKVVVYLRGAPKNVPGPLAAHSQSNAERWKNYAAAGAIGVASFSNPARTDVPWSRATLRRLGPVETLQDPALIETKGQRVAITINPAHADLFFAGTGHSAREILELDSLGKPLPKFPLKAKIRAKAMFSLRDGLSHNVAGVLPGSDPKLKNEYVVLSAHLDGLGIGGAVNGDRVYNGAMDNASGIASIIEIARVLAKNKPKRSLLFLAVTGEEGGLMGSKYYAAHPTRPLSNIVANVNLDMYLPLYPLRAITVYGLDESDLGPKFAALAKRAGIESKPDPEPERNLFIRSDQYSFIRKGVPSLAFKFHADKGSKEEQMVKDWLKNRYHAPSDDLKQPVDKEAAVQFTSLLSTFSEALANQPARPHWNRSSFFRRYAAD
jgi:hypothetical protein